MSARNSQKNYLGLSKPDNVINNGNISWIYDRNPESIRKRQEKAQLLKNLRHSFANNAVGRTNAKGIPGWSERKVTNSCNSPMTEEQVGNGIPKKSTILQEINTPRDKKPLIGRITSFSSRKRNLTYTVDLKKSSDLKFEAECKRNLGFKLQGNSEDKFKCSSSINDFKENFVPSVDLTIKKVEDPMLTAMQVRSNSVILEQNTSKRYIRPVGNDINTLYLKKFLNSNESCKDNNKTKVNKKRSQLPILRRSTDASSMTSKKINDPVVNKSLLGRRSMSALSCLQRNTNSSSVSKDIQKHSFTEEDDVFYDIKHKISCSDFAGFTKPSTVSIKVTKPSLSMVEQADSCVVNSSVIVEKINCSPKKFQLICKQQNGNVNSNETYINLALTQNNGEEVSCTQQEIPLNIPSHMNGNCIEQSDALYYADSSVANSQNSLSQGLSVESLQEILMQISSERKQINVAMDEICGIVQTKTKAIIDRYESSIEPLENLLKLQLEKFTADKISIDAASCSAPRRDVTTLNETSFKLMDYTFLGTPMPTKKKRLARSLSHPQALTEFQHNSLKNKKQHSDEKNSSSSADELSPFTNMVGDCERASLAPMTPKTRHNLFNLKESLNHQLDLLFD